MPIPGVPLANQLLAALPAAVYRRLLPRLEAITLAVDEVLFPISAPLRYAYFPTDGIVAVSYAVEVGTMAVAWPVGREGMVGISSFLGAAHQDIRTTVQFSGSALRIPASALRGEFRRAGAFQHLLLRYVFALVTQASQLGLCNQYHSIDQRLCRFLSRVFDRIGGDEVWVTQDRIAMMLGVRRESITAAAVRLQQAGIIRYERGHVTLTSRKKLDERACACGGIIRRAFAAVLVGT